MNTALKSALVEIKKFELFKDFDESTVQQLCENANIKVHAHKQIVFNFGEPATHFGVVLSGAYKLTRISPVGEESVIHFSSPGDVVAALVMTKKNTPYPVTVKSMGPARMLVIHQDTYLNYWIKNPMLIIKIQSLFSTRMARLQNHKVMQRAPMASKVASLLLQLAADDTKTEGQLEVPLPLTRKEIADSLGVTVESVIRVMSDWAKHGYISTTDHHIKILQPEWLIHQMEQCD